MHDSAQRKPFWNVIALGLQVSGIVAGVWDATTFPPSAGLSAMCHLALIYSTFSLLGALAAVLALARHERWSPLSTLALIINGTPCLFLVPLILSYLLR